MCLNSDKNKTFLLFLSQNRRHDNHNGNHAESPRGDKGVDVVLKDLCSSCRSAASANHVTPHLSRRPSVKKTDFSRLRQDATANMLPLAFLFHWLKLLNFQDS